MPTSFIRKTTLPFVVMRKRPSLVPILVLVLLCCSLLLHRGNSNRKRWAEAHAHLAWSSPPNEETRVQGSNWHVRSPSNKICRFAKKDYADWNIISVLAHMIMLAIGEAMIVIAQWQCSHQIPVHSSGFQPWNWSCSQVYFRAVVLISLNSVFVV